jgi:transcriptional regulator with XRE-family HTH domain
MTVGEQIRAARVAKRLSLRGLAATIGVSAPYMSQVEHDRARLSLERKQQIASVLGIDVVLLDAAEGYTRDLAHWIADNPELVQLLREARSTRQPLRIGGEHCRCCSRNR